MNFRVSEENFKLPETLKIELGAYLIGMSFASAKNSKSKPD